MCNYSTLPETNCLCLRGSVQSVWTTRPCTWCPSPATANRSASLPWATGPSGTPAFQEPGSTSACFIHAVRRSAFSFTRRKHSRLSICGAAKHCNKHSSLEWAAWKWTCVLSFACSTFVFSSDDLSPQLFLSHPTTQRLGIKGCDVRFACRSRHPVLTSYDWHGRQWGHAVILLFVIWEFNNKVLLPWAGLMEFYNNVGLPRWPVTLLN